MIVCERESDMHTDRDRGGEMVIRHALNSHFLHTFVWRERERVSEKVQKRKRMTDRERNSENVSERE